MHSARVEPVPPSLVEKAAPSAHRGLLRRALWDYPRQMLALALFVITGLVVCPLCSLVIALGGSRIPASAGQRLIRWLFATWLSFSQRIGVFDIRFPDSSRLASLSGVIIAPNHPGQLDAVILLIHVPRAVCIMRASLMRSPFLGGAARLARFIANDRGPALIREGVRKIQSGENLLIFPEGTRSHGSAVNSFKQGFALIAHKSHAPIHTVLIERHDRYLAKGVSLLAPTPLPIRINLRLGEVFLPGEGESPGDLARRMEAYFRSRLENTGRDILYRPSQDTRP